MGHHPAPRSTPARSGRHAGSGRTAGPGRRPAVPLLARLLAAALLLAALPVSARDLPLVLESVELEGAERTSRETVLRYLSLREGEAVTPEELLEAVDELREAELFASVDFRTERGSERGRFRLRLLVEEKGTEFRLGTGYRDLDGWYLIPAQLRFDNRLGRGERARLQVNLGYRTAGLEAVLDDRRAGDGALFWGAKLAGYGIDRPYFLDGVEYRHHVERGEVGAHLGRRFPGVTLEVGARFERIDADSVSEAAERDDFRDVDLGDELPFGSLPPEIADGVGETERTVLHAELVHDSRARRRIASTPVAGVWGRVRGEALVREGAEVGSFAADLRLYRRFLGGAFALRLRGGAIGEAAAFYDRFHLGGLYTVRGFPSQSLSPPGGDTRFWTSALEFRAPLAGPPARPRLLGFVFVDAGDGWRGDDFDAAETSASAGWGFRLRVPWIDSLGADFGMPITDSPVGESFHGNVALGWNF